MTSSQRSSSESVLSAEWLTDEKPDELGIVFFTFKNGDDSTRQNTKKFLQRCRSNPEGRWRRHSQSERILMLGKEKEEALNEQPITDQPQRCHICPTWATGPDDLGDITPYLPQLTWL